MLRNKFLRKLISDAAGFTLLETAVAMALLTMGITMVGSGVFQVLQSERFWEDRVLATRDLRHAGSWFAGDALSTKTTNLVDGDPAVNTVMLTTFAGDDITYSLSGQDLIRSHDNGSVVFMNRMATGVQTASYSLSSDVLTVTWVVLTDGTNTKTLSLNTKLR